MDFPIEFAQVNHFVISLLPFKQSNSLHFDFIAVVIDYVVYTSEHNRALLKLMLSQRVYKLIILNKTEQNCFIASK